MDPEKLIYLFKWGWRGPVALAICRHLARFELDWVGGATGRVVRAKHAAKDVSHVRRMGTYRNRAEGRLFHCHILACHKGV